MMNLKNNYLLKKLLKWANKKCKNFNINNVAFLLKNKEKHLEISLFYNCAPKILMIWFTVLEIWSMTDWAIYCPFTPLITWQIKIWKKQKKHLEMSSVYTFAPKIMIIWCMLPEIWSETDNLLSFWAIFALLPHYWPQKL